jgi:hypothetical protein
MGQLPASICCFGFLAIIQAQLLKSSERHRTMVHEHSPIKAPWIAGDAQVAQAWKALQGC